MKIIFMGTPAFAVPSFNALTERHEVLAVCTQPDRPAGRGHKLQTSPVKEAALAKGIPVLQPQTLRFSDPDAKKIRAQLAEYGADIFVVAAYGLLLPKGVLSTPPHGCINVHASLLPKYRGASPIHSAILNGDRETGITIMQMDIGLDTGDMILQKSLEISPTESFPELHDRLAALGAEALLQSLEQLEQIEKGTAARTPQNNSQATHAPLIKKSDGQILPTHTTEQILNKIRALNPHPGCYIEYNGQPLKIWAAASITGVEGACAGFGAEPQGLTLPTANGKILLTEVQAPGKKRMPAADFLRGRKIDKV